MIKKILISASLLFTIAASDNITWQELLKEKHDLIKANNCDLILKQHKAFINGQAPAISDERIKSIKIVENNEKVIDVKASNCSRIYMLPTPTKPFESDSCNSGLSSASLIRKTVYDRLLLLLNYLDLLSENFNYEKGKVNIAVFEGLRDISTQEKLFNDKRKEIATLKPKLSDSELDLETSKWVSPVKNNVPVHSTGAAVDIRLVYKDNFIDLGKFGVIWGNNPNAPTFSEGLTKEQKQNRLYLLMASTMAGLTNYVYEFWHYSFGDRYHHYWLDASNPIAQYDSAILSKL